MTMYTAIQHDNAREEIIAAFEGYAPRKSDQYETHGMYAVDNETHILRNAVYKSLNMEIPPSTLNTHKKSLAAHITRGTQRVKGCSKELVNDHVFKQCRLIRSVDGLNPIANAWVHAAYLSQDSTPIIKMMVCLYKETNKVRKGTEQKIEILCLYAVQNAIAVMLGNKQSHDIITAHDMKINRAAYCESWKPRMLVLIDLLIAIDHQYLDSLCLELNYPSYAPSFKSPRISRTRLINAA